MTQEMLRAGTTPDLADYIRRCEFPADAFLLLEKLPQEVVRDDQRQDLLCFTRLSDAPADLASFTAGRVFNPAFELRWEQGAGAARVVYLGKECDLPPLVDQREGTFEQRDRKSYYLFGTRLKEKDVDDMGLLPAGKDAMYYAELRIPRLLRYPVPDTTREQRVQLVVGEYHHDQERLFRFLKLVPVEKENEREPL